MGAEPGDVGSALSPALCLVGLSASQAKHCEHTPLSFKPSSLYSPTTILKYQRGNCFDFSVLLCSMLIGAGYDAYCVHGYATREICTLDETLELCPLLGKLQEVRPEVSGQVGAQHACSACSFPVSSRVELGATASDPHWVSVCTKQGPHQRDFLSDFPQFLKRPLCHTRSNTAKCRGLGTGR